MKNKFIKVHQTASRLRYKYFLLKEKFIDENILKNYLEKVEDVKSVRINKKAFSIVFEIQSNISSKIEEILSSLTIEELLKFKELAPALNYAHPTVEHFAPIFVTLGASSDAQNAPQTTIDGYWYGLSKRSFQVD